MTPPPARTIARRPGAPRPGGRRQPTRSSQPRSPPGGLTEARGASPRGTGGDRPSAGGSCPGEAGRALLEEGADSLRVILGGDGLGLRVGLEAERGGQVYGGRAIQQRLGETEG